MSIPYNNYSKKQLLKIYGSKKDYLKSVITYLKNGV